MGTFTTSITINAPVADVWTALAAVGDIYLWNPGVRASHTTSEQTDGLGSTRYCDLGGGNFLDEQVVHWQPKEALTMRVTGTNLPFSKVDIRFTLAPENDSTAVTVSPIYQLKYGPLGSLLDRVYVRNSYRKGMDALLAGLKDYVEAEPGEAQGKESNLGAV